MSLRPRYMSALCTKEPISSPPPRTLLLQPAALRARTEQGGAETHHRRAGGDSLLEVVGHAHRELPEAQFPRQPGDDIEGSSRLARVPRRRHRHEPVHLTPG